MTYQIRIDPEKELGPIRDMHGVGGGPVSGQFTFDAPKEIHSDMTHYYTKEGTRILAGKVISCLEERLGLKAEEIDYDALFASGENVLGI